MTATTDADLVLDLLNGTRVSNSIPRELAELTRVGELLRAVVRGTVGAHVLDPLLHGVARTPALRDGEVRWTLQAPPHRVLAVRAVLAWAELNTSRPGRLRPCANDECQLFLLDNSTGNTARWCSMAVCGNRVKARRHHERSREGLKTTDPGHRAQSPVPGTSGRPRVASGEADR